MSEYLELLEDAFDALQALLDKTHHGKGAAMRGAYLALELSIEEHRKREAPAQAPSRTTYPERWQSRSTAEREREVLDVLSGERFTIRELLGHLRDKHPELSIDYSNALSAVTRLYKARELDRTGERYTGGGQRLRYRYFKRTELEGPIADLQRAFDEEPSDG